MTEVIYRSRNLKIAFEADSGEYAFTLRFHGETATGRVRAGCPLCHGPSAPAFWEIEGPDGDANTVWLTCTSGCAAKGTTDRWSREIEFSTGWQLDEKTTQSE